MLSSTCSSAALHCGVNQSSGQCQRCMALEVPPFSVDARVFMVVSYLETLNFVFYHLSDIKSWQSCKIESKAIFVGKFLCCSELFVFDTDTQVVTSGECGSELDQRDLEGLHKICHNL